MGVVRGLCIRFALLRLSVKICVSCVWCCVLLIATSMAFDSAMSMFCNRGSLFAIRWLLVGM